MKSASFFRTILWLAPFTGLTFMTFALLRPAPVFPVPEHYRLVTDAQGLKVVVPQPFRTIAGSAFLEVTHAPEAVYKMSSFGGRRAFATYFMSRFYPQLLADTLWDCPNDIESVFAHAGGVTFFSIGDTRLMRRLGLPLLTAWPWSRDFSLSHTAVRVINAALGHEAEGEAMIADQQQAFAELRKELRPETLTTRPRLLHMFSSPRDWNHLSVFTDARFLEADDHMGVVNAGIGFENPGRYSDAERVLAMDPDIIFLYGGGVASFLADLRWQQLKAVRLRQVYAIVMGFRPGLPTYHLDDPPLMARFGAEIAHPDRLRPKIRDLTRAHFLKAYGYRLSDDEIDDMLRVADNIRSAGFGRFVRSTATHDHLPDRGDAREVAN